ncbi:MAG TPA: DUF2279 domain-containing protein [Gemmatimonadaceae bacterium]|nr:DUF2279 domain-containing protein [Gemmatimonadaceae bacterium]
MKLRLIVTALLLIAAPLGAQKVKPADPLFGVDKVKHFFIAGFVESTSFAGMQAAGANRSAAKTGAIAAVAVVSIAREAYDKKKKGLFSFRDLAWDAIGASAALLVLNKTHH